MQKAQKQVNKETSEKGRRRSEEEKPARTLLAQQEKGESVLLPVVSEENGDLESRSRSRSRERRTQKETVGEVGAPPVNAHGERERGEGIRMVSASTKRDSGENQYQSQHRHQNQNQNQYAGATGEEEEEEIKVTGTMREGGCPRDWIPGWSRGFHQLKSRSGSGRWTLRNDEG